MVRHLRLSELQQHNAAAAAATTSTSSFSLPSSFASAALALKIPSPGLLHPLLSETSSNAIAVSDKIPGFKTSAAFLNTLRTNIYLSSNIADPYFDHRILPSPNPSYTSTPILGPTYMASSTDSLMAPTATPAPQDVIAASAADTPLAGVPPLTTYTATSKDDLTDALRLIADSVAQQRQTASRNLLAHPLVLSLFVAIVGMIFNYFWTGQAADLLIITTTSCGLIMAVLLSIRLLTAPYLDHAEKTGTWTWLGPDSDIIITKYGNEIIGAVVVTTTNPKSSTRRSQKNLSSSSLQARIRAWTVLQRYRHAGIGGGLLEEAVRLCRNMKNISSPDNITFAPDHANSARLFPDTNFLVRTTRLNRPMERKEEQAQAMLEEIKTEIYDGTSNSETNGKGTSSSTEGGSTAMNGSSSPTSPNSSVSSSRAKAGDGGGGSGRRKGRGRRGS